MLSLFRGLVMVLAVFCLAKGVMAGEPTKGKKVFNKCKACHHINKKKNKLGPHLVDVMGRAAGSINGYKYSKVMKTSGIIWDQKTLDGFLKKPKKFLKGTKMAFVGLRKKKDRDNVIAYLKLLSK